MNLANLPDIQFCERDTARVEQEIFSAYEAIAGTTLYPGDPVRLFLESLAYIISQQRFIIDFSAKQNLLAFAQGEYLDHLGALLDVPRLAPSAARATLRFSLTAPLDWDVVIPAGTRATPDNRLMFAVDAETVIPAGAVHVDALATCRTTGAAGNGYVAGQINRLVDPVAHVVHVSNTSITLGGSDVEVDAHLRGRIQVAPEKFSVAGPDGAYLYWALSAHQDIVDVGVWSPAPGQVDIRPLMTGGELPTPEILAAVDTLLQSRKVRPLTDQVFVQAPEVATFDLDVTYHIRTSDAALASQIQTAVQSAVDAWLLWQRTKLGRDITPTELISRMHQAGAKRVALTTPAFQALEVWQVAHVDSVSVLYGGLEDE